MDTVTLLKKYKLVVKGMLRNNEEWLDIFDEPLKMQLVRILSNIREHYSDKKLYSPSLLRTLAFLKNTTMSKTKVVIVSDMEPNAVGYCLATRGPQTEKQRLIRELAKSNNNDTFFKDWIKQNVMLMPTSLSIGYKAPKNHKVMWRDVIIKLVQSIDEQVKPIWWVIGKQNKYISDSISVAGQDFITDDVTIDNMPKLIEEDPFGRINSILQNFNHPTIQW